MKFGITAHHGPPFCWISHLECNLLHPKLFSELSKPAYSREDDIASYASLLRECTSSKSLPFGQLLHDHITKAGLEGNAYLGNLIMNMYGHFDGCLPTAYWLFAKMSHPDIFSWNFIIRAYQHAGLYMEALGLFQQMLAQGAVLPDQHIFVSVVSVCTNANSIEHGKYVHVHVTLNGFESEIIMATALINMYGRCGCMVDAWLMFDKISSRDTFVWTTFIAACIEHGHAKLAFQLMKQLQEEGLLLNKEIILTLLDTCSIVGATTEEKHIHASIAGNSLGLDTTIQASLSKSYMHSSHTHSRQSLVPSADEQNMLPNMTDHTRWQSLSISSMLDHKAGLDGSLQSNLKQFSQEGLISDALETLAQMKQSRVLPDKHSLAALVSACASQSAILEGEQVYAFIMETCIQLDGYLGTALIKLFSMSGKLEVAKFLFDRIPIHDVASWTAMMNAYLQNGEGKEALLLYKQMKLRGFQPNEMTFATVLDACICDDSLIEGQQVHQEIIGSKFEQNLFVGTTLVKMYGRFSCLEDANFVFDKMPSRDVIAWNALIAASAYNEEGVMLFQQCRQMQEEGTLPNKSTYVSTLNACATYECLIEGKWRHSQIVALDYETDMVVGTALINMYGRCKCLTTARSIYEMIPYKDTFLCTVIISAYAHNGQMKEAFLMFDNMLLVGIIPDNISCISILSACVSKAGLDDGRLMHMRVIFCELDQDAQVVAGLINMYGKCGSLEDALRTLQVASRREIDMYVTILSACANLPDLIEGRTVHIQLVEMGFDLEVAVGNALINMYSKCGLLEEARQVFENLPKGDIVSWTVMITAHAQHGQGEYALHLFDLMQSIGIHPNMVTFTNLLNAFTHAGMVDEGFHCLGYFCQTRSRIQQMVDHYNIIVDLLGKAGRLSEAEELIKKMPFSATACTWTSMLDACRNHLDVERGERVAEHVFRMRPNDRAPYITMNNMYMSVGRSVDAAKVLYRSKEDAS